jgi:hypothetical protein
MKTNSLSLLAGVIALAGAAFAQVPPTNDTSDAFQNTGMGTGALQAVTNPKEQSCGSTPAGCGNTASGYDALFNNAGLIGSASGSFNTAIGSGALSSNLSSNYNTATGYGALYTNNSNGCAPSSPPYACSFENTATGYEALYSNSQGIQNTAVGAQALYSNTSQTPPFSFDYLSGSQNTAVGFQALYSNVIGSSNTAVGWGALYSNTGTFNMELEIFVEGQLNTAVGTQALFFNTTGSNNTAVGYQALQGSGAGTGSYNTAIGEYALFSSSTGGYNVALGYGALDNNTTGQYNTASGVNALYSGTSSTYNTATGYGALYHTTGSNNAALGFNAGFNLTTGSNNIEIGNPGVAGDTNTIRIGVQGAQTLTYVAGIYGHSLTGSAVVVTPSGELGVVSSSERFKTAISPMGSDTAKLAQLRPVTFKLKTDVTGTRQYGLIAEEVAKVYPELVIRNEAGRIDGVRYDELAPMLLNEIQKQAAEIRALKSQVHALGKMQRQVTEMRAALVKLERRSELVAER